MNNEEFTALLVLKTIVSWVKTAEIKNPSVVQVAVTCMIIIKSLQLLIKKKKTKEIHKLLYP